MMSERQVVAYDYLGQKQDNDEDHGYTCVACGYLSFTGTTRTSVICIGFPSHVNISTACKLYWSRLEP